VWNKLKQQQQQKKNTKTIAIAKNIILNYNGIGYISDTKTIVGEKASVKYCGNTLQ